MRFAMLENEDISDSLTCAVREGRLDRVRELINKYGLSYSTAWSEGYALLLDAVNNKHTMITKLLLSYGSPVNSKDNEKHSNTPLHFAVKDGDMEIVQMLLEKGANIDAKDECGRSPLHTAIEYNEMEIMELLFNRGASVYDGYPNGMAPLHIAAEKGYVQIVERLLKRGAYINSTINFGSKKGYTPLCFAIKIGKMQIIKLLLSHGADINTKPKYGVSPLHIAVQKGEIGIVQHLLQNVANVNSGYTPQRRNGYRPLHHAVEKGKEEIVKLLLSKGAKVDSKGNDGMIPLHIAAKRGHLQIAKVLLKEGAYVDSVYGTIKCGGYTPLCFAVRNRHEKVVQLLLENGANVDSEDPQGNTILYYSVKKLRPINLLIIQHIFKYGPDINHQGNRKAFKTALYKCEKEVVEIFLQFDFIVEPEKSYNYHKMLYAAVENGYLRIVEYLLNKREEITKFSKTHVADANAKDENESISKTTTNSPEKLNPALLPFAVKKGYKEIVELLLQHGADINAIDKCGRTALHFTSINEDQCNLVNTDVKGNIAKLLLNWGADVNARNCIFTTLHIAVENEYVKVVEALLEHNADVNSVSELGITPLRISAKTGNKVISKMLLNKGANVNAKQHNGITALHLASNKGHIEVVEVLLRCGAKVNSESGSEVTPLHIAAQRGFLNVVNILLKFGADIDSRDAYGRTALHFAYRNGYIPIIVALLKHCSPIDYVGGFKLYPDLDFLDNRHYPREIVKDTLRYHIVKLKTANLYVNEENLKFLQYLLTSNNEINDIQYKCNEEIARMKSEKINNANVSFFIF